MTESVVLLPKKNSEPPKHHLPWTMLGHSFPKGFTLTLSLQLHRVFQSNTHVTFRGSTASLAMWGLWQWLWQFLCRTSKYQSAFSIPQTNCASKPANKPFVITADGDGLAHVLKRIEVEREQLQMFTMRPLKLQVLSFSYWREMAVLSADSQVQRKRKFLST